MDDSQNVFPVGLLETQFHNNMNQMPGSSVPTSGVSQVTVNDSSRNPPPGVTILAPGEAPPAGLLAQLAANTNPRSCIICRKRKVRCDKSMPCSNCTKNKIQCVFPAPGRAPRKPRAKDSTVATRNPSDREIELLNRLHKLEAMVEELSSQLAEQGQNNSMSPSSNAGRSSPAQNASSPTHGGTGGPSIPGRGTRRRTLIDDVAEGTGADNTLNNSFGRLVLHDKAKGQYVANAFWSKLASQLDEIRTSLAEFGEESDYSDEETPDSSNGPVSTISASHQGFMFGYQTICLDLAPLQPPKRLIPLLWQKYLDNVEPVVKLAHIPTWQKAINEACTGHSTIHIAKQSMLFAIYFSVVSSMEDDEVQANFNEPRIQVLGKFRFAFEQSLAKANFLTECHLDIVNALALFITVVRSTDDSRFCWTMTALVVRLAEALGLQRDGTNFELLSVYDIEIRRRIWWIICSFDLRASEESGTDSAALIFNCDTQMPTNCNDADFDESTTELSPRTGPTDMSLAMVRHEITHLCRKMISMANNAPVLGEPNAIDAIKERERILMDINNQVRARYFSCPEAKTHKHLVLAEMIWRVVIAKMSLVIHQPLLLHIRNNKGEGEMDEVTRSIFEEVHHRVFTCAVEIVRCNHSLHTEDQFRQWRWLFATYTQWHAVSFVLMECAFRPWTASIERGFQIVNQALRDDGVIDFARKPNVNTMDFPIENMLQLARIRRQQRIKALQNDPQEVRKLDIGDFARARRRTEWIFQITDETIIQARQHWLEIVGATQTMVTAPSVPTNQETPQTNASFSSPHPPFEPSTTTSAVPSVTNKEFSPQIPTTSQDGQVLGLNILMNQPINSMVLWNIIEQNSAPIFEGGIMPPRQHQAVNSNSHIPPRGPGPAIDPSRQHTMGTSNMPGPVNPSGLPPNMEISPQQTNMGHMNMGQPNMAHPTAMPTSSGPWNWSQNWYPNDHRQPPHNHIGNMAAGNIDFNQMLLANNEDLDIDGGSPYWEAIQESFRNMQGEGPFQGPTSGI